MAHILINLELRTWDNLRGVLSVLNAKQLILSAMQDQCWRDDGCYLVGAITGA